MTTITKLKAALTYIESTSKYMPTTYDVQGCSVAECLRSVIAEMEAVEPVVIVILRQYEDGTPAGHQLEWQGRCEANDFPEGTALYTHPQPKA
jgi:hypothetical protein